MSIVARTAVGLSGLLLAACGARTTLSVDDAATSAGGATSASASSTSAGGGGESASSSSSSEASSSTGMPPCLSDAECDDGVACTNDVCLPSGCSNMPDDAACDDGVFCTIDVCQAGTGCENTFSDSVCDDGIACTADTCDPATDSCRHEACDGMCNDGAFCNGVERCDTMVGCVAGPPACELEAACSNDSCNEASQACQHSLSGGGACLPSVRLLGAAKGGELISINPFTGSTTLIAAGAGVTHFDIALLGSRWFALDDGSNTRLVELVPMTNQVKKSFFVPPSNSLSAGPDGKLYAASDTVYRLDPDTGVSTALGMLPPGYSSSGDIAFVGQRMFISADGSCGGGLVEFDLTTGTSTLLGGDGLGCVYGLAVANGVMFILNCDGNVGTFDPTTGVAQVLSSTHQTIYGADTLP